MQRVPKWNLLNLFRTTNYRRGFELPRLNSVVNIPRSGLDVFR